MFDLRYHVASLAAVFVALVLGIFVGVGLSGKGFVSDAERENLQASIDALQAQRDGAVARAAEADRRGEALDDFAKTAYPELVRRMLDGKRVGVLFVGSVDQGLAGTVRRTVADAAGRVTLVRALRVPLDSEAVDAALRSEPDTRELVGTDNRERLGRELARELVTAGPNPVFDRLAGVIVEEQTGAANVALDAVVVARPGAPQQGETGTFLAGLYSGLAAAPVPTVGVEKSDPRFGAIPVFGRRGLATVDGVDAAPGQVALTFLLAGARPGSYGVDATAVDGVLPEPPDPAAHDQGVTRAGLTVLVAARDEAERIGRTVSALCEAFTDAEIVVADDGSRDGTAAEAEAAGARVVRLPRRGKGQALTLAERACREGPLLLCDADLTGDLRPLVETDGDVVVAVFARRTGGGLGIAKGMSRALIQRLGGRRLREPLSGQRALSQEARRALFPVAAGFGVETRMTIDALRAGLDVSEVELELEHRATGRDAAGFTHRGRQLRDLLLAALAPQARSFRGLRLPLVGGVVGLVVPSVAPVAAIGLADDLWSGPERGFSAHLRAGTTTGTLKLVGIPLWAVWRTRSLSGAVLVGLSADVLNQLDTRPGRALKAFAVGSVVLGARPRRATILAVLLAPYDLREMTMLGDAGSNAFGAVLGLESVRRLTGLRRASAIGALAAVTLVGERRSLGALIEATPGLRSLDALGRHP